MKILLISIRCIVLLISSCAEAQDQANVSMHAFNTPPTHSSIGPKIPDPVSKPDCIQLPPCSAEDKYNPQQCVAYRYAGKLLWESQRLQAWGPTVCHAQKALADKACKAEKDMKLLSDIVCVPDTSGGSCPATEKTCKDTGKPKKCRAKTYEKRELTWDQRPSSWGHNGCQALNKLHAQACELGLNPKLLGGIECELDKTPGQCPPPIPNCLLGEDTPTKCQVDRIGKQVLKKPWTTQGTSLCEAQYQMRKIACMYPHSRLPLRSSLLEEMQCRGRDTIDNSVTSTKPTRPPQQ